jgi:hypothetical protein
MREQHQVSYRELIEQAGVSREALANHQRGSLRLKLRREFHTMKIGCIFSLLAASKVGPKSLPNSYWRRLFAFDPIELS